MKETFRWSIGIALALPLGVALWWLSAYTGVVAGDIAAITHNPSLERAGILASSLVVGIVPAVLLALPFVWIYGRWAVLAAASVSAIVALSRLPYALNARSDFATVVFSLEVIAIAICLPVAVWAVRRLRPNNSFKPKPLRGSA